MIENELVKVVNTLGLHARAAARLVNEANRFRSEIFISRGDKREINAKSIMGVLTLAASKGSEINVRCKGEDASEAIAAIKELFESGFGEE